MSNPHFNKWGDFLKNKNKKHWGLCRGLRSSVRNTSSNLCCLACRKQGLAMEQVAFEMGAISSLSFCTGWWLNHGLWAMVWLRSSRWLTATLLGRHKLRLPMAGPEQRLAREQSVYETGRCLEKDAGLIKEIWQVVWVSRWSNYHKTGSGGAVHSRGITHGFCVVEPSRLKGRVLWSDGGKIEGSVGDIQLNDQVRGYEVKDIHKQFQPKTCHRRRKSWFKQSLSTFMQTWTIKIIAWALNKLSL